MVTIPGKGMVIFYPLPMFVSLVTHGLQAVVISLISHNTFKSRPRIASGIGVTIGGIIMVLCWKFRIGSLFDKFTGAYDNNSVMKSQI